ncbi:MAG TPA: two-component regulator propeller domain-containing protein [Bryobacteraceae bacterium]|nr:two-component regulator propeller domain-containing protein [Bryobacteraceae bacterium]
MWPKRVLPVIALSVISLGALASSAFALNPSRALSQYTRTVWTQEHGLPQDTVRAITQTKDGYLWLGTDEGLAQFDGYDFVVFNKENGALPSNSVGALWAAKDGSLWIGTLGGLTRYRNGKFTTFTKKDGLDDTSVNSITEDRSGAIWVVAGVYLNRFQDGKFTNYSPRQGLPIQALRTVYCGRDGSIYVAGFGGVVRMEGNRFVSVLGPVGDIVIGLLQDRRGNLWVGGSFGVLTRSPSGELRRYTVQDGLPDNYVRAVWEDRDGNLWAGTDGGIARLENGRFVSTPLGSSHDREWVRCIYEDTEGNLWLGMSSGLNRLRNDLFSMYGVAEGLPSDEPTTVYQDHRGRIWVGFHDSGLVQFADGKPARVYTQKDGLPSNEIFSIRENRDGDLLIAARGGPSRLHDGYFVNPVMNDPLNRRVAFDYLQDRNGRLWVASPAGVSELAGNRQRIAIPGGSQLNNDAMVLGETRDGSLWAGTYGDGLWQLNNGVLRLFTTADGLSSNQIRSLVEGADGTLWIGTFGGGLDALRNGQFFHITVRDGLLSDNVSHIEDDRQGSLWLSTTRGICRVRKQDIWDFVNGKIRKIEPVNYGVADGLRSAQCAPGYPTSRGGTRSSDGRLWFPTSLGLAVLDPRDRPATVAAPVVHLLEVAVDGRPISIADNSQLAPGSGRMQFRYTGIYLSAPERVRYSYRLDGLDGDWVTLVQRRVTNYNSLPHGHYRFTVRASVPNGPPGETSLAFDLLPHFYERAWFRYFCAALAAAAIWGVYNLRLRQIRQRFSLVLEERGRLAREIHDTLAQGFVGISSQLDAVALTLNGHVDLARKHLELARKMVRHSLTEARRSVMDLRASALEGHDLPAALSEAAYQWTAGSPVEIQVDVEGESRRLPEETEQHLLRIAQEAVTNAVKHAHASQVRIHLEMANRKLSLRVADNGQGFEQDEAFSEVGGHFGLLGMRERAERLGGELRLHSERGQGTEVAVTVPLS